MAGGRCDPGFDSIAERLNPASGGNLFNARETLSDEGPVRLSLETTVGVSRRESGVAVAVLDPPDVPSSEPRPARHLADLLRVGRGLVCEELG